MWRFYVRFLRVFICGNHWTRFTISYPPYSINIYRTAMHTIISRVLSYKTLIYTNCPHKSGQYSIHCNSLSMINSELRIHWQIRSAARIPKFNEYIFLGISKSQLSNSWSANSKLSQCHVTRSGGGEGGRWNRRCVDVCHEDSTRSGTCHTSRRLSDSLCDSVCTIKPKRHRDSPSEYLAHQLILGQKVKGHGHRVTKCKSIDASCYRLLEQHARCSSVAVPLHTSYSRIRLGDRMAGVTNAPLSSALLVVCSC